MKKVYPEILILYVLLLFINNGRAQDERGMSKIVSEESLSNTYAIIIGISNYQNVKDLQYADLDAMSFATYLTSKSGGSIGLSNLKILLNEEATAVNLGSVLDEFAPRLKAGDRLILFFAGHGDIEVANQNNGLLLLHKAPASSYFSFGDEYLKVSDIRNINQVFSSNNVEVVIITDACRSGQLAGGSSGLNNTSLSLSERWGNETKILSCQPNEISLEGSQWGGGHGVFTYFLVNGLYGLADQDNNGKVTLMELDSYLKTNVIKETSPALQTPFVIGNYRSTLSVFDQEELISIKNQIAKEFPVMASVNTKGTIEQLRLYPDSIVVDLFEKYQHTIKEGHLIVPEENCALFYYYGISSKIDDKHIINTLKRNLAASLQDNAMEVILPILKLEKFEKKPIDEYNLAALELTKAIELLGSNHYLSPALKIRSLFLEAYALCEEYDQLYTDKVIKDTTMLVHAKNKLYEAIEIDSTAAYPYFQLGSIEIRNDNYEEAIKIYQKYTEMVPNNKRAYNNLGYAYDDVGEYDLAIKNYNKVIELDSGYAKAYGNIGALYGNSGDMEKASTYFKISVEKDSSFFEGYFNLGLVYFFTENYDEAIPLFEKVIQLKQEDIDSYYYLSAIYAIKEDDDLSISYLKKSFESGFDNFKMLESDTCFINIRHTKSYKKLIKEYKNKK